MNRFTWSVVLVLAVGSALNAREAGAQTTVDVAAVGLTFDPMDVTIEVDDSVHWTGLGGGFHTVAEADDAGSVVWNDGFHSPDFVSEFTHTFTTPGLYYYICEPHVVDFDMRGTVTVNAPALVPTLSAWGVTAMILLTLTAGTVVLGNRRRVSRPL